MESLTSTLNLKGTEEKFIRTWIYLLKYFHCRNQGHGPCLHEDFITQGGLYSIVSWIVTIVGKNGKKNGRFLEEPFVTLQPYISEDIRPIKIKVGGLYSVDIELDVTSTLSSKSPEKNW